MITTYAGENDAVRVAAVRKHVADFVAQYTDMGLERLDGEEVSYDRILEAAQSIPFLVERKLVVLKSASLNKEFTERFDEFLDSVSESTEVLLEEGKLDKRTSFYKQLQKKTEFSEFKELDVNGLVGWVNEYVRSQGGVISGSDARFLVERLVDANRIKNKIGANQMMVKNELDKLLLNDPAITRQTIELLTEENPSSKIFDLLDAALSGNAKRTLGLYRDQRSQGVEPQQLLSMIVWQLYALAVVKVARGRSVSEVAARTKMKPFVVEKSMNAGRRMTLQRLRDLISNLRELDVRSKTEGIVLDDALQYYLLTLHN